MSRRKIAPAPAPVSTPATPVVRIVVSAEERLALSMLAACAPAARRHDSRLLTAALDVLNNLAEGRLASAQERLAELAGESL